MTKKLKISLVGSYEDQENVRFASLVDELRAIHDGLVCLDKEATDQRQENIYYRVVNLSHGSPATLELEAVPFQAELDTGAVVFSRFVGGWNRLAAGGDLPPEYSPETRRAFGNIRDRMGQGITKIVFSTNGERAELTASTSIVPIELPERDRESLGSIVGPMERINIHGKNEFTIYPIGGARAIQCHFREELMARVLDSIGKRVRVFGKIKYHGGSRHPSEILVQKIKTLSDINAKSTLADIRGMAPDCTGDQSSEDFLEGFRNHEW